MMFRVTRNIILETEIEASSLDTAKVAAELLDDEEFQPLGELNEVEEMK